SPIPATIIVGAANGSISACSGSTSSSPNIQQFTVSGNALSTDITATAPIGFEVSLSQLNGYSGTVTLMQSGGTVNNTTIYVRSAASAITGNISGDVVITSAGVTTQNVVVTGLVNALPTVNIVSNQMLINGAQTTLINYTGTAGTFNWINDTPGIGLPASGMGDISPF